MPFDGIFTLRILMVATFGQFLVTLVQSRQALFEKTSSVGIKMNPHRQNIQIAKELSDWVGLVAVLIHHNGRALVRGGRAHVESIR